MIQPRRGNYSFAMMYNLISYCVWHQPKAPEILQGRNGLTSFIAGQFYASRFKAGFPLANIFARSDFFLLSQPN